MVFPLSGALVIFGVLGDVWFLYVSLELFLCCFCLDLGFCLVILLFFFSRVFFFHLILCIGVVFKKL